MREHLQAVARSTGRLPPELMTTPVPAAALALWDAFAAIAGTRGAGAPISWQDLAAWQQANGVRLSPWEADTIIDMDRAARAVQNKDAKP